MSKCGAHFTVMDYNQEGYTVGDLVCGLPYLHTGPHLDDTKNYTWGPVAGWDLYRSEQKKSDERRAARRNTNFRDFLRKYRNTK